MKDFPLASIVIVTYKQQDFIRETLRGAFAQTYPNLEIVISDDCSPDNTWQVIEEEVNNYKGSHRIKLNRNRTNIGIGANIAVALRMAEGEIIVQNDGDDISLPNRVEKTVETFAQEGLGMKLLWCNHERIDQNGKVLGPHANFQKDVRRKVRTLADVKRAIRIPFGAVNSWRREVNDFFGGMNETMLAEDNIIGFRALLLGKVGHIPDVLVQYRQHVGSILNHSRAGDLKNDINSRARSRDWWFVQAFAQHLVDIALLGKKCPEKIPELCRVQKVCYKLLGKWLTSYRVLSRFPNIPISLYFKILFYPTLWRFIPLSILYKLGIYTKRKK